MKTHDLSLKCPSCDGRLQPVALGCGTCGLKVEGQFAANEFSTLSPEDLQFLRVFVHCEGRVREMEGALGLSYPTIRARLTSFKERLSVAAAQMGVDAMTAPELPPEKPSSVLEQLKAGEISYEDALAKIKTQSKRGKK